MDARGARHEARLQELPESERSTRSSTEDPARPLTAVRGHVALDSAADPAGGVTAPAPAPVSLMALDADAKSGLKAPGLTFDQALTKYIGEFGRGQVNGFGDRLHGMPSCTTDRPRRATWHAVCQLLAYATSSNGAALHAFYVLDNITMEL